jgi:hypothetical protein
MPHSMPLDRFNTLRPDSPGTQKNPAPRRREAMVVEYATLSLQTPLSSLFPAYKALERYTKTAQLIAATHKKAACSRSSHC